MARKRTTIPSTTRTNSRGTLAESCIILPPAGFAYLLLLPLWMLWLGIRIRKIPAPA